MQEGSSNRIQHEGFRVDALFYGLGDVAKGWRDLPQAREIYN